MWNTRAGGCRCRSDEEKSTDELPRIDDPPHPIDGEASCAAHCDSIATEPSLPFDQPPIWGFEDEGLGQGSSTGLLEYYAALLTDADALDRIDDASAGPGEVPIDETDFSSEAILVVQAGWGSSSRDVRIKRIEETDDGIHAHGCYTECSVLTDLTFQTTAARFERPDTLESATVSLTIDPETRVTFRTSDGIVDLVEID